ncbi:hypothetical protein HK101_009912 [Irineochytrium annulatum]|nr:hypothetical protein HK101_009912 [Irineochytrium annulatum]
MVHDVANCYFEETDTFATYFAKPFRGFVYYSSHATDGFLVSYTLRDMIVSTEIEDAKAKLGADPTDLLDLMPEGLYIQESDVLSLVYGFGSLKRWEKTEQGIDIGLSEDDEIVEIQIHHAGDRIAYTLLEGEMEIYENECRMADALDALD